ncbi:hypothetical protein LVC96_004754, partial [Salmonella enterica]|nr:hypothetical protein [Salmonella enterica]
MNNVTFTADNNFSIDAVADRAGARISGANITATKGHINLTGSARKGGFDAINDEFAGVILYGDLLFKAGTGTTINATHLSHTASYSPPVPLVLEKANITFDGGANIDACGSYAGIVLASPSFGDAVKSQVFVKNGDLNINATLDGQATTGPTGDAGASASGAIVFQNEYNVLSFELNVDKGSNVTINADSSANKSGPFAAFAAATPESTAASTFHNGFVFSGEGNISVNATSDSADAVNLRLFNNENLSGNLTITGVSDSGIGVNFDKYLSTAVHNATISGKSESGTGVKMTALNGSADLNGNSVSGSTVTGDGGIVLSGSNVTITNGTMVGKATAGNGTGVSMTGGSSYTLDGASVAGTAVDGAGISASGNLSLNHNTTLNGSASGQGTGVSVAGNLQSDGGVTITGNASAGDGVQVSGNTSLNNATLSGTTLNGNGVNIAGNLTTDSDTRISGRSSANGTGVNIGGNLSGANVRGVSVGGTGIQLSDAAGITGTTLNGSSTSGNGLGMTGNVVIDQVSASRLNATSQSGSGLALADAVVRVVDGSGVAASSPVRLTGKSVTGSGVTTSGNTTLSAVVLAGTAGADGSAGLTVTGCLTLGDTLSGLTGSTSGNGTAVVVDNATINADSYTQSGQVFTVNANTTGNGTAIKIQGDNHLEGVTLNGSSTTGT